MPPDMFCAGSFSSGSDDATLLAVVLGRSQKSKISAKALSFALWGASSRCERFDSVSVPWEFAICVPSGIYSYRTGPRGSEAQVFS